MEFQCPYCPYVYNKEEGDPDNGIAPGTKFEALSETWMRPVCEAEKMRFGNQKYVNKFISVSSFCSPIASQRQS